MTYPPKTDTSSKDRSVWGTGACRSCLSLDSADVWLRLENSPSGSEAFQDGCLHHGSTSPCSLRPLARCGSQERSLIILLHAKFRYQNRLPRVPSLPSLASLPSLQCHRACQHSGCSFEEIYERGK